MMDHKREQEVWQRVMAMSAEAPRCDKAVSKQNLTAEQIMELLCGELANAATYEALACRVRGQVKQKLMVLAGQERQHAKKLAAIYYVMTGKKPCPDRPKCSCIACTNEELRERYIEETAGAEKYCCLAEKAGSFGDLFRELASDETRHAQTILNLLHQCL